MGPNMTEGQQAHVGNSGADGRGGTSVVPPGVWVDDSDEDDPVLRKADGSMVDTWREEYPYPERMTREEYDHAKRVLQVELLKLQYWIEDSGGRLVIIFEGRDAAGNGIFSVTSRTFRQPGRSSFSTVPGITVPVSKRSWAFAPMKSMSAFCSR